MPLAVSHTRSLPRCRRATLAFCAFAAAVPCADAQSATDPPRVEVQAAVIGVVPAGLGTAASAYSPPLLLDGDFTSHGAQTLSIESGWHPGFEAGASVFLVPAAGIQVTFDRDSSTLAGANGPYDVSLHYTSRQPPDNAPQPASVDQSTAWPATTGTITRSTLNADAVVRLGRPDRVSVTLSGGLSVHRFAGEISPVGYTTFRLGGHSVLFQDNYQIAGALAPTSALGFNLGGDIGFGIGRGVAVTAGYRYLGGPAIDVPVRDVTVLNPDAIAFAQTPAEIQQRLALPPVQIRVCSSRLSAGIKLFF